MLKDKLSEVTNRIRNAIMHLRPSDGAVKTESKPDKLPEKDELPPGYFIETDGKEWRWAKHTSFGTSSGMFPKATKKEAIKDAWNIYNYLEQERMKVWKKEET
jgi:hypothetical protein